MTRRRAPATLALPEHWTGYQALAVLEFIHAPREHHWTQYGLAVQQAWRDQLRPENDLPQFDPDDPI